MNVKNVASLFLCSIALSGCGPSDSDAQKLGFKDAGEMKQLNARGYATKDEYVDAAYRSPSYCFGDGREAYAKKCQGMKVAWVVEVKDVKSPGASRAGIYDLDTINYPKMIETVDVSSDGKESLSTYAYYVVDGVAGSLNTFYPDLNQAKYGKQLDPNAVVQTLTEIKKVGEIKEDRAKQLGFASFAEMQALGQKGFKTKQEYLDADQKAKEQGFESYEQQQTAKSAGIENAQDYKKYLKEQEAQNAKTEYEANRKAEWSARCANYESSRKSCAGSANYSRCMDISYGGSGWSVDKDACQWEGK